MLRYPPKRAYPPDLSSAIWPNAERAVLRILKFSAKNRLRSAISPAEIPMPTHERASRILEAWVSGNTEQFQRELEETITQEHVNASGSRLQEEEKELLQSVASDLWRSLARPHANSSTRFQSNFALLQHLSRRLESNCSRGTCAA